jgi:3-hydroxyisobutyrate dehydrogenase-like beta-hydroxyacid dehydrogenase
MSLARKDLLLIHDLAESLGTPMPQADIDLESYGRAIDAGFGDQDMAALARYLRTQVT